MRNEGIDEVKDEGGVEKDGREEVGRSNCRHFRFGMWLNFLLGISENFRMLGREEAHMVLQSMLPFSEDLRIEP